MKLIPYIFCSLIFCMSCSLINSEKDNQNKDYSANRQVMEVEAKRLLCEARQQLLYGNLDSAKSIIEQMRKDCYLALDARKRGILLMDSIDLKLAQKELAHIDSLMSVGTKSISQQNFEEACRKVQFYERKIHYDKNRLLEKDVK